jgi:hypothetical protein
MRPDHSVALITALLVLALLACDWLRAPPCTGPWCPPDAGEEMGPCK